MRESYEMLFDKLFELSMRIEIVFCVCACVRSNSDLGLRLGAANESFF